MNRSVLFAVLTAVSGLVGHADAGCNSCGCNSGCKVCRLVPEVTKVTTYEYRIECEDFCLHGRSQCCGSHLVPGECCGDCPRCEKIWKPTCGCVKTKGKLVKIPVVKEKCGWKCVVVSGCRGCGNCCADARVATAEETQLAIETARQQGILLTAAEEPIVVTIPEELPAVPDAKPVAAPSKLKAFLGLLGN
jgi:hypothetical protein